MDRLEWSLKQHFYHLCLRDEVRLQVSQCKICQKMKRNSTNFAQLPAREATSVSWEQVHLDLISPLNIKVKGHKKPVQFIALTCIDPVLNLLGWNSQGQDIRTSYKDVGVPVAFTLSSTMNMCS
jgi:hypothetical protein